MTCSLADEVLASNVGRLVISKDLEKSVDERLDMLHQFFIEKKKADAVDSKVRSNLNFKSSRCGSRSSFTRPRDLI